MSVRIRSRHADLGGHFNEDAPRPPVPGMEGDTMASPLATHGRPLCHHSFYPTKGGGGGGGGNGGGSFGGDSYRGLHDGSVSVATPRRSDLDLGYEPEGSASPTPPYLRWAESLHSLLDDEDGIQLFRAFLCQESCGDLLDFWFACSGFRKLPGSSQPAGTDGGAGGGSGGESGKRLKLAKAIYRKYIADGSVSVAARQIKPATRTFIRDCVSRAHLDAALFDQAQTEVQAWMEENTYPLFLKSDVYLKHAREHGSWGGGSGGGGGIAGGPASRGEGGESSPLTCGGEDTIQANGKAVAMSLSPASLPAVAASSSGAAAAAASPLLPGYLPTLMEDKEWERTEREGSEADLAPVNRLTRELLMETAPHRATGRKPQDGREFRHVPWREPVNPYYVNTGYARAPATSANDSEQQSMSSDADTISLTDSSVDGIPPYRYRKHHRKEMQESAKVNGRVPLPHIPRTHRLPKDVHVEPEKFALELISRLETVQREREAQERLEERLRRVRMEEEGDDADVSVVTSVPSYSGVGGGGAEDDAERILDEHVQRVMKTPGCHSPRSPPHAHAHAHAYHTPPVKHPYHAHPLTHLAEHEAGWNGDAHHYGSSRGRSYGDGVGAGPAELMGYGSKGSTLSRRGLKPKVEVLKSEEGRGLDGRGVEPPVPVEEKIMQWMMEGESSRHKKSSYSGSGSFKRSQAVDLCRPGPGPLDRSGVVSGVVGLGAGGVPMVPHGWSGGGLVGAGPLRGVQPSHPFIQDPTMPPNPAPNPLTQLEEARRRLEEERRRSAALQAKQRHKSAKRPLCENVTVAYYFCGEPIPYRTSVKGRVVTLGQFKELLTKKGAYRFYFKKVSDEFDCGVVFEEVREDDAILPIFEERIIGKVEKID
ncbi:axin-1-like [Alosa pseudoharengus]|uniref:axin-1-like n=1 Tax=Alosa pseudoharengus TaxID=34774 RepID=UPI003F8AF03B